MELISFQPQFTYYSLCTKASVHAVIVKYLHLKKKTKTHQAIAEENPLPSTEVIFFLMFSTNFYSVCIFAYLSAVVPMSKGCNRVQ